ncbi:MAG: ABC transporter permease [Deltaproteobacteria bacterium]|nr:ABC transporter permease [Deltaproteobacteria bacterium]
MSAPLPSPDARSPLLRQPAVKLGSVVVETWRAGRALLGVFVSTLRQTRAGRREPGEVGRQMFEVGNRSLFFLAVTLGFIAMVSIFQVCLQLNRVTGDLSKVGLEFIKLIIHESAPTLTAMMLATRVGAGIAAEVGSMVVTEQVDALRMCGVDPVGYLVVPRFLACLLMVPAVSVFSAVIGISSGCAMAYFTFGVNPRLFLDFTAVTHGDVITGVTKSIAFGAAIPVVSGYCGLTTHGGSEGVGSATTRAVINSSIAVLVLDFLLGTLSFIVFPPQVGQ